MARVGGTTAKWRRLRQQAFEMYGRNCWSCGEIATEIDHVIELDAGGADSIENLQPLCHECHKTKTALYNAQRLMDKKKAVFLGANFHPDPVLVLSLPEKTIKRPPMPETAKIKQ